MTTTELGIPAEATEASTALRARTHLACVRGPDLGTVIALDAPRTLGRDGEPSLFAASVSRSHARVTPIPLARGGTRGGRRQARAPVARVVDLGSSNGTRIRHRRGRTRTLSSDGRRGGGECATGDVLAVGDLLDLGEDRFVVRARPEELIWPEPQRRSRHLRTALPYVSMILLPGMLAWRLVASGGTEWRTPLLIAFLTLVVGLVVLAAARVVVSRRRWRGTDSAHLTLVLASRRARDRFDEGEDAGRHRPAPGMAAHPPGALMVWPGRPGPHGLLMLESDTSGPAGARIVAGITALKGTPRSTDRPVFRIGLIGPQARETARWIVAQLAARTEGVDLTDEAGRHRVLGAGGRPVHFATGSSCPGCAAMGDTGAAGVLHLGIARSFTELPTWCDRVLRTDDAPVSSRWWDQVTRPPETERTRVLPERLLFEDRGSVDVTGETHADGGGMPVVLGHDAAGPVVVDLLRDGPHALVAGTTGSGKSEALTTWLLALCTDLGPDRLRLVLIDYKGGATLAPLSRLPQTEDVLTDLDPSRTERAIRGLSSLLHTREQDLARLGLPDLTRWQKAHVRGDAPSPPPRVVIAVDEFRVLADQHPRTLDSLVRLCAQGRSLGFHLILATQRPSGAITPAMRANIELRLALRCAGEADSLDVIGSLDAARLPRIPGRAVLRYRGALQIAWVHDVEAEVSTARDRWRDSRAEADGAIGHHHDTAPAPLWTPELPDHLTWERVDRMSSSRVIGTTIGLVDGIDIGVHLPLVWTTGSIRIEGPLHEGAELGRAALAVSARLAERDRLPLHVCSDNLSVLLSSCATWIQTEDAGACAHLLAGLPEHGPAVLCIQDAPNLIDVLELAFGPGRGRAAWDGFLTRAPRRGIRVVSAHSRRVGGASSSSFAARLIRVTSAEDAVRAGLRADVPRGGPPGRFIVLGSGVSAARPPRTADAEDLAPLTGDGSRPLVAQIPLALPDRITIPRDRPTWAVRGLPVLDREVPRPAGPTSAEFSCVGAACRIGDSLRPWFVHSGLRWVIVARNPAPALAAVERAHREAGLDPPPLLGPTARATSRPTRTSEPGIVLVDPRQCALAMDEPSDVLLALDPDEATVRVLADCARQVSPALRAERWTRSTGVALIGGTLSRMALVIE